MRRLVAPALVLVLLFAGVGVGVGFAEAAVLSGLVLWVVGTAWLPRRATGLLAAVYLALLAGGAARLGLGDAWGAAVATATGLATWWLFPRRVSRRVAFAVPLMVLLVFVVSVLLYLAPGSPFDSERGTSRAVEAAERARFGVADTPLGFFAGYVGRLATTGSLGPSIKVQGRSVLDLLLPALPVSASLGLLALLLAVGLGLALGVRAGLRPGSASDHGGMALATIGISIPNFVIGAGLILLFSFRLGWFPVAGWGTWRHLVLPALTLGLPYAAYVARLARAGTLEVMQQDFIRTARAKGLSEREVVWRHAIRGAVLPVVSFLGPAAAGILTGSFVVEQLFGIPGLGQWFVRSATGRDYAVVLGTAIVYFAMLTVFNLVVDLAYAWLDPRVREGA